jgi:hypothetical protein
LQQVCKKSSFNVCSDINIFLLCRSYFNRGIK